VAAASPVEQFEDELLQRQCPRGCVVDLDLGSSNVGRACADELQRWSKSIDFDYCRANHVDKLSAYRHMVTGHLDRVATAYEVVVVVSARTNDRWAKRKTIVEDVARAYLGAVIVPVFLHRAVVIDSDMMKRLVAEAVLRRWGVIPPAPPTPEGRALGTAATEALGDVPFVLAVGGDETQQRAAAEFPDRVEHEFGIEGQWIMTDYGRPGRVVDEIKTIQVRFGDRMVGAIFAQLFNATDVKRDGQAYLRGKGVLSITPRFKSVGSALAGVSVVLGMYVRGEAGDDPEDDTAVREDGNE
jgi:hypothetical protein